MDISNLKTKTDEAGEVSPMDSEAISLVGELSRAGSMSSMIEDAPASGSASRAAKLKRKRRSSPKKIEAEDDSDFEDPVKVDPDLELLRKQRAELEAFLFTDTNKINKTAIRFILNKWNTLEEKLQDCIIENKILKEKLTFAESAAVAATAPSMRPYAEVVAEGVSPRPTGPSGSRVVPARRKEIKTSEVILIKPTREEDARTSEELKNSLTMQLEPLRTKLKVKGMRATRQKGLLIEDNSKEDINIIKSGGLDKVGLKAEEPKKLNPSIIIYDVEKEHTADTLKVMLNN